MSVDEPVNDFLPTFDGDVMPQGTTDRSAAIAGASCLQSLGDYAELKRLIRQQGLLEKRPAHYTRRILLNFALLALCLTILVTVDIIWIQLINAAFLAIVSTQIGLVGHDSGHRQIADAPWINELLSLVHGNLLIGMSASWWIDKHNKHHGNTNVLDADPDIDIPLLAFTPEQSIAKQGLGHFVAKHQAFLFFPLLLFEAYHLRFRSIKYLLQRRAKHTLLEGLLLIAYLGIHITLLLYFLGPPLALAFLVVHQGLFGICIGTVFAPNHKGMLVLTKDHHMDYLRHQVLTSRDLKSNLITTWWYGGQNFQIEHHLFPSMPASNYQQAQQIVRAFCEKHGVSYYEIGVLQSFRQIFRHLHQSGAQLRRAR